MNYAHDWTNNTWPKCVDTRTPHLHVLCTFFVITYYEVWEVFPHGVGILVINVFFCFALWLRLSIYILCLGVSPGSDPQVISENVRNREQILQTLTDLSRSFQDIADRCLLVLHLEVR